jgi:acyl-CoA hydrolase
MSKMPKNRGKTPSESATQTIQVVLPNDANPLGNVLGGRVMHWIDMVGAVVAVRHSRKPVVTASMERLDFHSPIRIGQIVHLSGTLHYVGRTSMQVGVEVHSEDPMTGTRTHTSSAVVTYVALGSPGRPVAVPGLVPETRDEKRLFREAEKRRKRLSGSGK